MVDQYLAKNGYEAQQQNIPDLERPDNLWDPVPGNYGAHGEFDGRSSWFSLQYWFTKYRKPILASALAIIAACALIQGNAVGRSSLRAKAA